MPAKANDESNSHGSHPYSIQPCQMDVHYRLTRASFVPTIVNPTKERPVKLFTASRLWRWNSMPILLSS